MTRKFILSACLFALAVISSVCYGAEISDRQALNEKAVEEFGKENVERFEQMFQTGEFDFKYHYDSCGRYNTVIHYAALMGDLNRVKLLVEKGADFNTKNKRGETVLFYAVQSGNLELVKFLVEKGADVNAKDEDGKTVLDYASRNQELVDWLKEHGAK